MLALLLLFVMVTIGVAGFANTHLQERSASNARLQAEAFKAASAGAANAINFFQANRDRTDINITDTQCGVSGHAGWIDGVGDPVPSDWVAVGNVGAATLSQRMYCLADIYPCDEDVEVDCSVVARPPRSQMFVLSRGEVTVDGKIVATRDVEVRLAKGQDGDPGDACGALCFPGCDINADDTVFPNSNSFQVDGNGGYAITAGCDDARDTILDEIRDNRIGNYDGGIGSSTPGEPWDTPENVEAFRAGVELAADNHFEGLNTSGNAVFGSIDSPEITYVEGNANIGGAISGAGIFMVNGDLQMRGTPAFQGLIVVLGGDWDIAGGGRGGNPGQQQPESGGSIIVLNTMELNSDGTFGEISFDNNGGGNALYRYDCDMLLAARAMLPADIQAMWSPECVGTPALFILGPERIIIASWRENIGWREELFAD